MASTSFTLGHTDQSRSPPVCLRTPATRSRMTRSVGCPSSAHLMSTRRTFCPWRLTGSSSARGADRRNSRRPASLHHDLPSADRDLSLGRLEPKPPRQRDRAPDAGPRLIAPHPQVGSTVQVKNGRHRHHSRQLTKLVEHVVRQAAFLRTPRAGLRRRDARAGHHHAHASPCRGHGGHQAHLGQLAHRGHATNHGLLQASSQRDQNNDRRRTDEHARRRHQDTGLHSQEVAHDEAQQFAQAHERLAPKTQKTTDEPQRSRRPIDRGFVRRDPSADGVGMGGI